MLPRLAARLISPRMTKHSCTIPSSMRNMPNVGSRRRQHPLHQCPPVGPQASGLIVLKLQSRICQSVSIHLSPSSLSLPDTDSSLRQHQDCVGGTGSPRDRVALISERGFANRDSRAFERVVAFLPRLTPSCRFYLCIFAGTMACSRIAEAQDTWMSGKDTMRRSRSSDKPRLSRFATDAEVAGPVMSTSLPPPHLQLLLLILRPVCFIQK